MPSETCITALAALGFTTLEAEVYAFLLEESPATGYRIAQALGRPVGGIYKTLDSLANKGAVMSDDGASRLCRAVPAPELLARLERSFTERKAAAEQALAELRSAPEDDRIYQLRTYEQVMERARGMLARCRMFAVVDGFPQPLEDIREELETATGRGVKVVAQCCEPIDIAGARVTVLPRSHPLVGSFPGQWLILTTDGSEMLLAFLTNHGDVLQGLWSGSPYVSWVLQCYMGSELNYVATLSDPETPPVVREIARKNRDHSPSPLEVPGFQILLSRYGHAGSAARMGGETG